MKNKITTLILTFLISGVLSTVVAQEKQLKIDELLNAYYRNGNLNGSVFITENGKPFYQKCFGYTNIEDKRIIEPDTKFLIASISKQYTAVLILKLAEEGKLKLTDKLSQYVTDYPEKYASKVTLHQMLCNTSGIPDIFSDDRYKRIWDKPHTYNDLTDILKDKPLDFEPGSQFKWSNIAWVLLGKVIERVSGKTYDEYFNECIASKLNLKNTKFVEKDKNIGSLGAQGYIYNFGEYSHSPEFYFYPQIPADGILTTPVELTDFTNALVDGKLLSAKSLELMFTPYTDSDSRNMKYGYGWYLGKFIMPDNSTVPIKYLPGGMQGYLSLLLNINNHYSIALFSNYSNAPMNQIVNTIANILTGKKYDLPRKPYIPMLLEKYKSEGIGGMMTELKKHTAGSRNENIIAEDEMNRLAYEFLNNGLTKESITIFAYITELFPDSWNAYDSLGEAYAKKGDLQKAILNYKKSVQLNPDNVNGNDALKKLEAVN